MYGSHCELQWNRGVTDVGCQGGQEQKNSRSVGGKICNIVGKTQARAGGGSGRGV